METKLGGVALRCVPVKLLGAAAEALEMAWISASFEKLCFFIISVLEVSNGTCPTFAGAGLHVSLPAKTRQ